MEKMEKRLCFAQVNKKIFNEAIEAVYNTDTLLACFVFKVVVLVSFNFLVGKYVLKCIPQFAFEELGCGCFTLRAVCKESINC